MQDVLLVTINRIKALMPVDSNLQHIDRYIPMAISAQRTSLRPLIGDKLYAAWQAEAQAGPLTPRMERLRDEAEMYIAWSATRALLPYLQYQIRDKGAVDWTGTNQNKPESGLKMLLDEMQGQKQLEGEMLLAWLCANISDYPEARSGGCCGEARGGINVKPVSFWG